MGSPLGKNSIPTRPVATLIPKIINDNISKTNVPINNLTGLHPPNALRSVCSYQSINFGNVEVWNFTIMSLIKYLLATTASIININRFPKKVKPAISKTIPIAIGIQKFFFLKIADFGSSIASSS